MQFKEVQINNRLQIDVETVKLGLNTYKGIIIDINDSILTMATDFGELVTINKNDILSITKINFDRIVSTSMINIRNYYQEKKELKDRLRELKKQKKGLIEDLFDANMLAKFNMTGVKNRLDKSIPKDLLSFNKGAYCYNIYFSHNSDNKIEVVFKISNTFEHYAFENIDMDKIIKVHAPNEKDTIEESFNNLGKIIEIEKNVIHKKDNIYTVFTIYKISIEIDVDNFIDIKEIIKEDLNKLKR